MNTILLANDKEYKIQDGASLELIQIVTDEDKAVEACADFADAANLSHVEFKSDDIVTGIYDSLVTAKTPIRYTNEDGSTTVEISLRTMTDEEKKIVALEVSQSEQNAVLNDLGNVFAGM